MSLRRDCLSRFRRDESGSVAIIFALLVISLFGVIAMAIDIARAQNLSSKIATGLDASALAGAKLLDSGTSDNQIISTATSFFSSHMASLRIHNVSLSNFKVLIDRTNSTVTVDVDANMATTFGAILGINAVKLKKTSTVNFKLRDVELALALDITGSMNESNKLQDLKHAAGDVLDTLLKDAPNETAVRVAIVPWSASVNAGSLAAAASANLSTDNCVVERHGGSASTDDAPYGANASHVTTQAQSGAYQCPPNAVVPLSGKSSLSNLQSMVSSMTATGGTAGHIGTAWGWYMLSPNWSPLLPANSKPAPYNPSATIKSILLMTDGEFNVSHLTSAPYGAMIDESYTQFQALCASMKAKKVNVFTVGFNLTSGSRAENELKTCASSASNFFAATNGSELKKAFQEVAAQLTSLRLSR
jgi:Flp pilus assembly protein TadG